MGLSDSRPEPSLGYVFPRAVGVGCPSPPRRVSQVPRLIYSCALSPTTPEGPTGACSLLPRRCQASSTSGGLATSSSVTRPNRVRLRYGSQVCFPGFHQPDCSDSLRFRYMYERAIYMVNSFQFTRSARLSLVYRKPRKNRTRFLAKPRRRKGELCPVVLCASAAWRETTFYKTIIAPVTRSRQHWTDSAGAFMTSRGPPPPPWGSWR